MNYKEFFTTDNKSGWKCREEKLKNSYPDIWEQVNNHINECPTLLSLPYREKIACFINNIKTLPVCKFCGKKVKLKNSIVDGYSDCCDNRYLCKTQKKPTIPEKYNVQYYLETKNFKEFFTTNNKCGWKNREYTLKKNAPEIFDLVKKFANKYGFNDLSIKEQIWYFINEKTEKVCCEGCGNDVNFRDTINKGYHQYCSLECANKNGDLATKAANALEEKYGVKYFSQHDSWDAKVRQTKLEKYGDENYTNVAKAQETNEKLYGCKFYRNEEKRVKTLRDKCIENIKNRTNDIFIKYDREDSEITLKCSCCTNEYEINHNLFNSRTKINVKTCTVCNPIGDTTSIQEKELTEFVKNNIPNEEIFENTKKVLPNKHELDIYIPNRNLAIEFNGCYWHSDKYLVNNYHLRKTTLCKELGIDLLHIFDNEWCKKDKVVKSIITNKLNLTENKIFARKTIVKPISFNDAKEFIEKNNIHKYEKSKINFGLYYNNELVSVMSFKRGKDKLICIMNHFVSKINYLVVGGFSKLLSFFKKNYEYKQIIAYSDLRLFTGNVFSKNGFILNKILKPDFFYFYKERIEKSEIKNNKFKHKSRKVFDCGKKEWLLTK